MKRSAFVLSFLASLLFVPTASSMITVGTALAMNAEHAATERARIIGWLVPTVPQANEKFYWEGDFIKLKDTGFCIGVDTIARDARLHLQTCDSSDRQRFVFAPEGDPDFKQARIKMKADQTLCLDMKAAADGNPALVILWPCHGGLNQLWQLVDDNAMHHGGL